MRQRLAQRVDGTHVLVLASRSPRRRVLLEMLTPFEVHAVDVEEVAPRGLPIPEAVQVIARKKALAAARERPDDWVLAADTVVSIEHELIGKARDEGAERATLARLSGTTHQVTTGLALCIDGRAVDSDAAVTAVHMARMPATVVDAYVASDAWRGKAGGYGIQDPLMAPFLRLQAGPWSNVVGLPLALTAQLLSRNGIGVREPPDERVLQENNPFA